MKPALFHFRKELIRRRLVISGVFIALGVTGIILVAEPVSLSGTLFAAIIVLYAYKLFRDARLMRRTAPAVSVGEDGIRDAHFGDQLIPWRAITELKATRIGNSPNGMVTIIADAAKLGSNPGPAVVRLANWTRGAVPGKENKKMALPMTATIALEATLDDLVEAIRSRTSIPVDFHGKPTQS